MKTTESNFKIKTVKNLAKSISVRLMKIIECYGVLINMQNYKIIIHSVYEILRSSNILYGLYVSNLVINKNVCFP